MNCPYEELSFRNVWDYLAHLQKCHIINEKKIEIYHICRRCLKVFETIEELQEHKTTPHSVNWERLFNDLKETIEVAHKGKWHLKRLMDAYRDQQNASPSPIPAIVVKPTDPRLHTPRDVASKIGQLTVDKKEKLKLMVMHQKFIESAYYRLFNHYTDLSLINKEYPQKIDKRVLKERLKSHKLDAELFERTRVCEFMELSISTNEEHCMYVMSRTINKFEHLWLLIHEDANPFEGASFTEPWMIFAIPVQMQKYRELQKSAPQKQMEFGELSNQLQVQEKIQQQYEAEHSKIELRKVEENKLIDQKIKKLEQLETHLRIQLTNQTKQQNDYESLTKQLDQQHLDDLHFRKNLLNQYYTKQTEEIQKDIINQSEQYRSTDQLIREKAKLIQRVEHYTEKHNKMYYETQELKRQITAVGEKLREDEVNRLKSQTKKQQKIVQHLCIKCNKNIREVIHFPCQHLLFCLQCFIKVMSDKKQQCPLLNIGQCREQRFIEKKAKSVKFKN